MNNYLIRNLVIYLIISGTLISPLAVTGRVYASLQKLPEGIGSPEGPLEEATEDQTTDEDDDETTSEEPVASQNRFCLEGTGGATGRTCTPCDPGLTFEVGCIDVLTGGPLDMPETATSDSGKGKAIGELKPQIAEKLQGIDNTAEKVKVIFENLENEGKVPPNTTEAINSIFTGNAEESTKAFGTLCEIGSKDKSLNIGKIDCSALEDLSTNTTTPIENKVLIEGFKILIAIITEEALKGTLMTPDEIGEYCTNNPGKCN